MFGGGNKGGTAALPLGVRHSTAAPQAVAPYLSATTSFETLQAPRCPVPSSATLHFKLRHQARQAVDAVPGQLDGRDDRQSQPEDQQKQPHPKRT